MPERSTDLGDRDHVVVALDGVLQRGGRHRELHRRLDALPYPANYGKNDDGELLKSVYGQQIAVPRGWQHHKA